MRIIIAAVVIALSWLLVTYDPWKVLGILASLAIIGVFSLAGALWIKMKFIMRLPWGPDHWFNEKD